MTGISGYLIGGGAVVVLWLATILKAVLWGAGRERDKQAAKERDSYAKHLQDIADAAGARPSGSVPDDPYNRDNR